MCLYVSAPLDMVSVPAVIAPKPTGTVEPLYHLPYDATKNYALPADAVPNGVYAVNGPHPSERTIGVPETGFPRVDEVKVDSVLATMGPSAVLPYLVSDTELIGPATQSHHYAEGVCENLGTCSLTSKVGDTCTANIRGQVEPGFCYASDVGTLQCGRTIEVHSRLGDASPVKLPYATGTKISRCPAGTPLTYPGKKVVKMLLIGGCMISTDPSYAPSAMIHTPEACATPADLTKGCIFPGAHNYAPGAVQPTKCLYNVRGCTKPAALNYNSEALVDDNTCEMPTPGCTVPTALYEATDSNTPAYKSLYVGKPTQGAQASIEENVGDFERKGVVAYPTYSAVKNYNPSANVLSGCSVVVEGCMDSTAVNYDPAANLNSNTWCVPRVEGCMMPSPRKVSSATAAVAGRVHTLDNGAANYSIGATVHVKAYCKPGRYGCTTQGMYNYDATATINDGSCWGPLYGCLAKAALNFNCSEADKYAECAYTERILVPTKHDESLCNYQYSPPPVASPGLPPGADTRTTVDVTFTASGTVSDYDDSLIEAIKAAFATMSGIPASLIRINIVGGSVGMEVEMEVPDGTGAQSVKDGLASSLATPESANAALSSTGVQVLSTPVIEIKTKTVITPPAPPPKDEVNTGAIVGGVLGGCFVPFLLCILWFSGKLEKYGCKSPFKKTSATYPA